MTDAISRSPQGSSAVIAGKSIVASICDVTGDHEWDQFLKSTDLGQFQQAAMWAKAKSSEGWSPIRVKLTQEDQLVGGFQLLWRQTRFGRIGYVSKGPVIVPEDPDLADYSVALLESIIREHRLRIAIVQAPDESKEAGKALLQPQWLPNHFMKVIDATLLVDLSGGWDAVGKQMARSTRKKYREAISRGACFYQGSSADLAQFFSLMECSARRQQAPPNPASLRALEQIWEAFATADSLQLFFTEFQGEKTASLLCIGFGKRFSLWKKGWNEQPCDYHPNILVNHEALHWACENGFEFADFCAINRQLATDLLAGRVPDQEQEASRHIFNLRFGAKPRLLPEARVFIPNRGLRAAYRLACRVPGLLPFMRKFVER